MSTVPPDSCLARVTRVLETFPIEGATSIQGYRVLGWQVLGKIDEFQVGQQVIYFSINTVFPMEFEPTRFLNGKPLKTKKMMGQLSQGLLGPVSWIAREVQDDEDLTSDFKLKKWLPTTELEAYTSDSGRAPFPSFIPKTSEDRVQNLSKYLSRLDGVDLVITEKRDGTSFTVVQLRGEVLVCGRNFVLTIPTPTSRHYFEVMEEYRLKERLLALGRNIAIQGEITGPKIGGNRHGVSRLEFHLFNVYSIDESRYLPWEQVVEIAEALQVPHVRVVHRGPLAPEQLTVQYFLELAEQQRYENGKLAEGIVVKTNSGPRTSFKAISNSYLLKYNL